MAGRPVNRVSFGRWRARLERWWPQPCRFCSAPTPGPAICSPCHADLPWLGAHCRRCALPLPEDEWLCGPCDRRPPPFQNTTAAWRYAWPVDGLIQAVKFQGRLADAQLLGELLAGHVSGSGARLPDAVVPVPLHSRRLRRRGFNQALEIARPLAAGLGVALEPRWLQRQRDTQTQLGLKAGARRRNVRDAFIAAPAVAGRHLALLDDVVTTGSTVRAAARALIGAGADRVDVWVAARAG